MLLASEIGALLGKPSEVTHHLSTKNKTGVRQTATRNPPKMLAFSARCVNTKAMRALLGVAMMMTAVAACSTTIAPGDEGGPCLADGGCYGGLTCIVNQCVEGFPVAEAGADAATVDDASDDAE